MYKLNAATINVGLIGYGFAGQVFHAPLLRTTPGLAITAVASRNPDKVHADLGAVTVHADPADLVADPSVHLVVLASPNATHFPLARAALAAGKHVVTDKPFTDDAASRAEPTAPRVVLSSMCWEVMLTTSTPMPP